jgi:uncharacterized protein DUF6492
MINRLFFILLFFSFHLALQAKPIKKQYELANDPIDVVIVTHPKDKETLDLCIEGIKENGSNVRRVILVSSEKLTDQCEWYDEKKFPFSLNEVALAIGRGSESKRDQFFKGHCRYPGWYFQQLLKLYSPYVIPGISSNVLVLDSDTIFMNPVEFLNESNGGLFCYSKLRAKRRYLNFAERFVPGYKRVYPKVYSICHHMLFQRPILDDLFKTVEDYHKEPFWLAFCHSVDLNSKLASEYEIYYSFALTHTDQVELRGLKWTNSGDLNKRDQFKRKGFNFVSFHTYMRESKPNIKAALKGSKVK